MSGSRAGPGDSPFTPAGKVVDEAAVVACLKDGMTLGIGGFGLDRKPMSLLRAIARSAVRDLTVETYAGGLDIELLVTAGKLQRVASCHVGLDHFGLAPAFRTARQSGAVAYEEWSELTQLVAWRAAAEGTGFATVQFDMSCDLLRVNPHIRRLQSPFDGRELAAVEAPDIDVAILHAEAVHPDGWAIALGDPYLDVMLARAAKTVIVSAERLIDDGELEHRHRDVHLLASYVDAVVPAAAGALPGSCLPLYLIDLPWVRRYLDASNAAAIDPRSLYEILAGPEVRRA